MNDDDVSGDTEESSQKAKAEPKGLKRKAIGRKGKAVVKHHASGDTQKSSGKAKALPAGLKRKAVDRKGKAGVKNAPRNEKGKEIAGVDVQKVNGGCSCWCCVYLVCKSETLQLKSYFCFPEEDGKDEREKKYRQFG
jgi:hypothetical protein